jgi:hypothetical protein
MSAAVHSHISSHAQVPLHVVAQDPKVAECQPSNASDIIARGRAALPRIEHNHWSDWRDVIIALGVLRSQSLHEAGTNKPHGRSYRAAIGRRLRIHGFDRIHKSERCRLLECADNLAAIDAWRAHQAPDLQLGLNHPRVVLAHWKRSLRGNTSTKPAAKPALAAAWKAATPDSRRELLDSLGRAELCAAMSPKLIAELAEHIVGLQVASAASTQVLLTQLLRLAISSSSEHESAAAIAKIKLKLKKNGRTAGDVVVSFGAREGRRRRI